tara:strand:- start:56 stop:469 length:414 start_codon:yes stop_codon:yes gene_type:complete
MKLFEYDQWKDQYYDHLLGYLYDICKYEGLKKVYNYKIDNLTYITDKELQTILDKFGEMSIFQSQLNIKIMKDKMWCEYCPLDELRRVIKEKYFIKIFEKKPTDEMLEESLEILIISEVIKIHEDERYKSIIKKFLD